MRVNLDRDRCQGVGMCESLRPDIFELDDHGELRVHDAAAAAEDARDDLERAVEACPTQALSVA